VRHQVVVGIEAGAIDGSDNRSEEDDRIVLRVKYDPSSGVIWS
jgi:hypothetical protein